MATIKIAGKEYPIKFTTNVLKEIQNRYGDVSGWATRMDNIGETLFVLWLLINEGIAYDNYFRGHNNPEIVSDRVLGMMLSIDDLNSPAIVDAIVESYNESLTGDGKKKYTTEELLTMVAESNIPTSNQNK